MLPNSTLHVSPPFYELLLIRANFQAPLSSNYRDSTVFLHLVSECGNRLTVRQDGALRCTQLNVNMVRNILQASCELLQIKQSGIKVLLADLWVC